MDYKKIAEELREKVKGKVNLNEPMNLHTTWRIGGAADLLVIPCNIEDIQESLNIANRNQLPITIVGGGSNILVHDLGIRGIVIKLTDLKELVIEKGFVQAGAGINLPYLAHAVEKNSLTGLEFATAIPGTVGGAVIMNAGAHGEQMASVVEKVMIMDLQGNISYLTNKELDFSYRYSSLRNKNNFIVIQVFLKLVPGDLENIRRKNYLYRQFRKEKQPLKYPNGGSVFKNPPHDSAGRLIDSVGAKGWQVGKAKVSEKHANFILNLGGASSKDVLELIEKIQQKVKEVHGVELEPEVIFLGG